MSSDAQKTCIPIKKEILPEVTEVRNLRSTWQHRWVIFCGRAAFQKLGTRSWCYNRKDYCSSVDSGVPNAHRQTLLQSKRITTLLNSQCFKKNLPQIVHREEQTIRSYSARKFETDSFQHYSRWWNLSCSVRNPVWCVPNTDQGNKPSVPWFKKKKIGYLLNFDWWYL